MAQRLGLVGVREGEGNTCLPSLGQTVMHTLRIFADEGTETRFLIHFIPHPPGIMYYSPDSRAKVVFLLSHGAPWNDHCTFQDRVGMTKEAFFVVETQSHYAVQAGLELRILLTAPPGSWDYRHVIHG
jgi:hypothetical protein